MNETPEELWKNAINGCQKSWNELYKLFGARLYNFFLKNTQNKEFAADKVQEVFLKVYRHKENFQYGTLKTWIFRIAKNLLIDEWRKSKNKEIVSEMAFDIKDEAIGVENEVISTISQEMLRQVINEGMLVLSQEDRLTIGLIYLAGLPVPDFAKIMEIPLGTAKTRVRAARIRLDKILKEKLKLKNMVN